MFFRAALFLLCVMLTSCSLRFNDQVTNPIRKVNTGSACLARAGDVVQRFTNGSLDATAHDEFYECVKVALTKFSNHTTGRFEDAYTAEELGGFLTRSFLDGKEVPNALLTEAMAFKQALVGGPADRLTRQDLKNLIDVIDVLKQYTGNLRPLMPLSASSFVERGYTPAQLEEALAVFRNSTEQLGDSIRKGQARLPFDRMQGLAKELGAFLNNGDVPADHWSLEVTRYLPAMRVAKAAVLSGSRDEIAVSDWAKVYYLAPRLFASYLRVRYYLHDPFAHFQGGDRQILEKIFEEFIAAFQTVIDQRPGKSVSSEEIDDFLKSLHEQGILKCRPETARQFVQLIFGKLLGSSQDESKFAVNRESLSRLKQNVLFAFEGLRATEALYRYKLGEDFQARPLTREEIAAVPDSVLLGATNLKAAISQEAVRAVKRNASELRVVMSENNFGVTIPRIGEQPLPYSHMVKAMGLRALNRLLMQAFGNGRDEKLSPAQLDTFLNELFPILVEYKITDEKMRATINKRVMEASLFLYSSDGDRSFTMAEALEYEALLLSTIERAPKLQKKIAELCGSPDLKVDEDCYREKFSENAVEIWSYLPGFSEYMRGLGTQEKRVAIFKSMERFLRKGKEGTPFTVGDSQSYTLLPYYMELLYFRFDANRDGYLDNAEAEAAYPVFQPFIAEKAALYGFTGTEDHKAIFNFLLANRMLPTDGKWSFFFRRYLLGPKAFRNDRGQIIEIFEKLLSLQAVKQ